VPRPVVRPNGDCDDSDTSAQPASSSASGAEAGLLDFRDPDAERVDVVGGKAAALAIAARAGLPALEGLIVPVGTELDAPGTAKALARELVRRLGAVALAARSSSPSEDLAASSMAGQFQTVLHIEGEQALAAALIEVAGSGGAAAQRLGLNEAPPVAVLVQPMVQGVGGVAFGVDPVTGRSDRRVIVCSGKGPDAVVSGRVPGVTHHLDATGRVLEVDDPEHDPNGLLGRARCREIATLVDRSADVFGSPQDTEFVIDGAGTLRLLQSRPVTTQVRGTPQGPVYGSGPVAETFPEPLTPLERSLWVEPLREALHEALLLSDVASPRKLRDRPVVVTVDGRVAVDLELVADDRHRTWRDYVDPRLLARRSRTTWRVARLRAALPALAADLLAEADALLAGVGPLGGLSDRQLVGLLARSRVALRALHGHEILLGLMVHSDVAPLTGAAVALRTLQAARAEGLSDEAVVRRSPVVLALAGPRVDGAALPAELPDRLPELPDEAASDDASVLREALRLRARWVQELGARTAWHLAERLVVQGRLPGREAITGLDLDGLASVVAGSSVVLDTAVDRAALDAMRAAPELPARFRFDDQGRPVPERTPHGADGSDGAGRGAGGGHGRGPVVTDPSDVEQGSVLVVGDLRPDLASVLGRLSGLVAESGSPLAHLAILAREAGVPTVVALADARQRFAVGTVVEVDGDAGTVREVDR
jgi:phosphohistidine swiveling domain-containing protein